MVKASEDVKTNTIYLTKIKDFDDRTFAMPVRLPTVRLHDKIIETQIYQKVNAT